MCIFSSDSTEKVDPDDEQDDSETVFLADQVTRSFHFNIFCRLYILMHLFSEASPQVDESDEGKRDKMLKKTYKGLVNLR
jgi:hypothetical protein